MTSPTTTIRVSTLTRDRLMRTRGQDFGNASLDEVIAHLLDEHADHRLRAQMRIDAERARVDIDDLAEVRRVQAEFRPYLHQRPPVCLST